MLRSVPRLGALLLLTLATAAASAPLSIVRDGQASQRVPDDLRHLRGYATLDLSGSHEPFGTAVAAVPLEAVLPEAVPIVLAASDGFSVTLTPEILGDAAAHGARAWIAIEPAPYRWRGTRGHDMGPYALVWTGPGANAVPRERWIDRLVSISVQAVDADPAMLLPEARAFPAGARAFATNCLPCHRLSGRGQGDKGPDLGAPMNVTRYITSSGFTAIVRNPAAVRHWPAQQMEGFPPDVLSDRELAAIWTYLKALDTPRRP